jgi:predicted Rossmann-fold nucleotide-binding protein
VIGVTCADIEAWRSVKMNAWVKEERRFSTLQERLNELVLACDAAIALSGGPGTLTEVALTWNMMIVNSIPPKSLILTGAGWRFVMESFFNSFDVYIPQSQRILLQFAPNIQAAVGLLANHD